MGIIKLECSDLYQDQNSLFFMDVKNHDFSDWYQDQNSFFIMEFIKLEFSYLYQDQTWLILFEPTQFNLIDTFNILRLMQEKDTGSFIILQKRIR